MLGPTSSIQTLLVIGPCPRCHAACHRWGLPNGGYTLVCDQLYGPTNLAALTCNCLTSCNLCPKPRPIPFLPSRSFPFSSPPPHDMNNHTNPSPP